VKGGLICRQSAKAWRTWSIANLFSVSRKIWFLFGAQKGIAVALLLSVCCALLPIPLLPNPPGSQIENAVSLLRSKDCSEPFPCQNCRCGCSSAEQCWTSCCCYSLRERIAWAKKNKVTPPAFVAYLVEFDPELGTESSKKPPTTASITEKVRGGGSCHSSMKTCCNKSKATSHAKARSSRNVIRILALKCQGRVSLYSMLPWFNFEWEGRRGRMECVVAPAWLIAPDDWKSMVYPPDTPPPKNV